MTEMIRGVRQRAAAAILDDSESSIEAHNLYVTYVVILMMLATGHRPVSDIFSTLDCFDQETGLVSIEDKAVDKGHEIRVVAAPPMLFEQLELYLMHLQSVYLRLQWSAPELAMQILSATQPAGPRLIPLFFYLDKSGTQWNSIRPATLEAYLGNVWMLPLNVNRDLIATGGRVAGCPSFFIDAQLGHQDVGCEPNGSCSPISPIELAEYWTPLLQKHVEELGISVLPGWKPTRGKRIPILNPKLLAKTTAVAFGPEKRRIKRSAELSREADAVDALIPELATKIEQGVIEDALLKEWLNRIAEKSPFGRFSIWVALLRRRLASLRRAGVKVALPGRVAPALSEPSPFSPDTFPQSQHINKLRAAFLEYFDRMVNEPTCAQRVAEIVASAVLFSAELDVKRLQSFLDALRSARLVRIENRFILIHSSESAGSVVWQFDPMSAGLLIGYDRKFSQGERESCSGSVVASALGILANEIGWLKSRNSKHVVLATLLRDLVKPAKGYWSLRLSGMDYAVATGKQKTTSLTEPSLVRLMTGKRVLTTDEELIEPEQVESPLWTPAVAFDPSQHGYSAAAGFWKRVVKIFYEAENVGKNNRQNISKDSGAPFEEEKGGEKKERFDKRSRNIKRRLEPVLKKILNQPGNIPPIGVALVSWAYTLSTRGTPSTGEIRANTVFRYVDAIGRRLLERAGDTNFFALPDFAVEDIYADVAEVSCANVKHPDFVVSRLMEFHEFLISTYGVPDIDWTDIVADLPIPTQNVDVGIVTDEEYWRAFRFLRMDASMSERDQRATTTMLVLLYRFGLRPGELFLLKTADLSSTNRIVIRICNSVYGETKSDNGVRAIPWMGNEDGEDLHLVKEWHAHAKEYGNQDSLALLFGEEDHCRTALDRSLAMKRITEALRAASGDQSIRPRHLRHSFASRLWLAMILESSTSDMVLVTAWNQLWPNATPEDIRQILVGNSSISRRSIWAIALALGHVSPSVSFRHYVHLIDFVRAAKLWKQKIDLSQKALGKVLCCPYATIRTIRAANKDAAMKDGMLFFHFAKNTPDIKDSELIDETDLPQAMSYLIVHESAGLSFEAIDRILCLAGIRDELDGLAERFLVSEATVREVVETGRKLQRDTGFRDYGLDVTPDADRFPGAQIFSRHERIDSDSVRLRSALRLLSDDAATGANLWLDYRDKTKFVLIFELVSDLQNFIDSLLQTFEMTSDMFELLIPAQEGDEEWQGIRDRFSGRGLKIRNNFNLGTRDGHVGLRLRHGQSKLKRHRAWDRLMFVVTCRGIVQENEKLPHRVGNRKRNFQQY